MSTDNAEIRKAIAEFMGWTEVHVGSKNDADLEGRLIGRNPRFGKRVLSIRDWLVPDYSNDLNAIHLVEGELERRGFLMDYDVALYAVVPEKSLEDFGSLDALVYYREKWALIHATAAQRALAAYQVITQQQGQS